MAGFDVNAARQAGYSDDEILAHLTATRSFDVSGAMKSGYSKPEVIDYLSTSPRFAANAPGVQRPSIPQELQPGMTQTPQGAMPYAKAVQAGPYQPAGQAEAAMGFGTTTGETLGNLGKAGVATAAGVVGAPAATAAADSAIPFLRNLAQPVQQWAARHPKLTALGEAYAISQARKIPFVGKYIPSQAELAPLLLGKAGPGAAADGGVAAEEAEAAEAEAAGKNTEVPEEPTAPVTRPVTRQQVNSAVDDAFGVQPQQPNAPIYNRGGNSAPVSDSGTAVPEGHTPVNSSAVSSYKYDPAANEFHAVMKSNPNTTYVYGDVSPDQVEAFESAGSKGKAFQSEIRGKGSVPVAQINNSTGKRISIIPSRRF